MHKLPPLLEGAPFRVAEGLTLGLGGRLLRPGVLTSPHHGVRSVVPVRSVIDRCAEILPIMPDGQAFSHVTAAALWGLPLPDPRSAAPLHVTSVTGARPRRPGVIGHRERDPRGSLVHGLPVVEPLWAWAQCAALLPLDDVIAMGDALAGRWSKHEEARELPLERLEATVRAWGTRRGARTLREAMHAVRPNVWSPKETQVRLLLVRAGLPEPECNGEVTTRAGEVLGHADLVYRGARLAIEYEGDQHRTDRAQWRRDIARYELFQQAGWRVTRVTDDDLATPGLLRSRVSRQLAEQALQ